MAEKGDVIKGLEKVWDAFNHMEHELYADYVFDALAMLKEKDGYVSVPFSWLVKFCTHIDFKEPVTDEERELLWKQKLKQQFGIDLEEGEVG